MNTTIKRVARPRARRLAALGLVGIASTFAAALPVDPVRVSVRVPRPVALLAVVLPLAPEVAAAQPEPEPEVVPEADPTPGQQVEAPPPSPPTIEERGRAALALVHYPYERTGFTIRFEAARPGFLGLTSEATRTITIYLRPSHTIDAVARTIAHEIGHAIDLAFMNNARRAQYLELRGLGVVEWMPCERCSDYASPAGDFAEVFAMLVFPTDPTFRSKIAAPPSPAQLAELKALFYLPPIDPA